MKATDEKALEARGWRSGDVADFLGLTDAQVAIVDFRVSVAKNVRLQRERLELSQEDLAKRISSTQPRVARIEAGGSGVSLDLLVKALFAVGGQVEIKVVDSDMPSSAAVKKVARRKVRAKVKAAMGKAGPKNRKSAV